MEKLVIELKIGRNNNILDWFVKGTNYELVKYLG